MRTAGGGQGRGACKRDWVRATEIAVKAGRYVALLMVIATFVLPVRLCVLPLIAAFVWFAGGQELFAVRMRHGLSPFSGMFGDDVSGTGPSARPGGPGGAWTRARGNYAEEAYGPAQEAADDGSSRGFSEEDIEEMERFRGRWREE